MAIDALSTALQRHLVVHIDQYFSLIISIIMKGEYLHSYTSHIKCYSDPDIHVVILIIYINYGHHSRSDLLKVLIGKY